MLHKGLLAKIVGGELKLVFVSVMIGIVCGAVIWEKHGDQVKAWMGEHKGDCPFHPAASDAPASE